MFRTLYDQFIFFDDYADQYTTKHFYFVDSALPVLSVTAAYLYFVLKLGPAWMKHRPALQLDNVIRWYNIAQIVLNSIDFLMGTIVIIASSPERRIPCAVFQKELLPLASTVIYLYLFLKLFDFCDTIIFVMRKKFNQITFLHVFHHTGMLLATWVAFRFFPNGSGVWIGYINLFVHIVMYSYYQAANIYKNAPWLVRLKKHITQLQLAQFTLIAIVCLKVIMDSECPYNKALYYRIWNYVQAFFNFSMVYLFSNFYYKTYIKKKTK